MKIKPNYIIIPLITIATSISGSLFTMNSISTWYETLIRPEFNPPNWIFGPVWTTIYILTTISALLVWNKTKKKQKKERNIAMWLFGINALLNASWSYVFFTANQLQIATIGAGILGLSVLGIMIYIYRLNKTATWLLLPYVLWVSFATFLSYTIYLLNI